jgi:iron-sulfur cluster repair protein YtfE (RIC family)
MNEPLLDLVSALREELQQYGEMFALLEQQQEHISRVDGDRLMETVTAIHDQVSILHKAREHRADCLRNVAQTLSLGGDATFKDLQQHLAEEHRPLIGALIEENNTMLLRIHQRARQNHILLSRSLELMQALTNSLGPFNVTTYDAHGGVTAHGGGTPALCDVLS